MLATLLLFLNDYVMGGGLDSVREEDEEGEVSLNDHDVDGTPRHDTEVQISSDDTETPMQRAPFTDITPEATPIARKRTYRRDEIGSVVVATTQTSPGISRAPHGSPLASIINAINFSDPNVDSHIVHGECEDDQENGQIPQISISSHPIMRIH